MCVFNASASSNVLFFTCIQLTEEKAVQWLMQKTVFEFLGPDRHETQIHRSSSK